MIRALYQKLRCKCGEHAYSAFCNVLAFPGVQVRVCAHCGLHNAQLNFGSAGSYWRDEEIDMLEIYELKCWLMSGSERDSFTPEEWEDACAMLRVMHSRYKTRQRLRELP